MHYWKALHNIVVQYRRPFRQWCSLGSGAMHVESSTVQVLYSTQTTIYAVYAAEMKVHKYSNHVHDESAQIQQPCPCMHTAARPQSFFPVPRARCCGRYQNTKYMCNHKYNGIL